MGDGGPDPRILGYLSSAEEDAAIIRYDILGSQAHVLMLLKTGIVSRTSARRILGALSEILRRRRSLFARSGSTYDGKNASAAEDIHELVESLVVERAGAAHGGRMHAARSRNDQVALDVRMKVRDDINVMCGHILDAAESMVLFASNHRRTVMPLYTHMQQAQAGLFSHWLLAHADALLRDYERLSDAYGRVNKSPLGAGPVGGTSLPIDRAYTAELLGFDELLENSLDATGTRDFAAEYAAAVSIMMSNLSRLAEDLVVWSTSEFSFVELEDDISSPSSAMPQKKNPDVLEITRARAAEAAGYTGAMLGIMGGLASGYGRDLQRTKPLLWMISDTGVSALLAVQSVLGGMRVNKVRMRRVAEASDLVALDVAERLVLEHDVPFRTAHGTAALLVQHAHTMRKPVRKMTASDVRGALRKGGSDDAKPSQFTAASDPKILHAITSSLGPVSSLRGRVSRGSSGYAEQKRMISARKRTITRLRNTLEERNKRVDEALASLKKQAKNV